jgi:cobalt/nickel transport system permease protein
MWGICESPTNKGGTATADFSSSIRDIYSLEQLSEHTTCIHRLHPVVKLLTAFCFIVAVVSFDRYAVAQLIPYVFYPTVIMALSETPYSLLLKRALLALPFCLLAGFSALLLETGTAFSLGGVVITSGMLVLFSVLFKTYLCVMAVLLLVATTPVVSLTDGLRALRVPSLFINVFEMTYRYIGTLLDQTGSMYAAYKLRGGHRRGIELRYMGAFLGQLLLRSFDRAERVYSAMQCRGYALRESRRTLPRIISADWLFLAVVCGAILLFRVINIVAFWNEFLGGLLV